jgi:hypothetical protein
MQSSTRAMRPVATMTLGGIRITIGDPYGYKNLLGDVRECPHNALIVNPH